MKVLTDYFMFRIFKLLLFFILFFVSFRYAIKFARKNEIPTKTLKPKSRPRP